MARNWRTARTSSGSGRGGAGREVSSWRPRPGLSSRRSSGSERRTGPGPADERRADRIADGRRARRPRSAAPRRDSARPPIVAPGRSPGTPRGRGTRARPGRRGRTSASSPGGPCGCRSRGWRRRRRASRSQRPGGPVSWPWASAMNAARALVAGGDDPDPGRVEALEQAEEALAGHGEGVADAGGAKGVRDEPADGARCRSGSGGSAVRPRSALGSASARRRCCGGSVGGSARGSRLGLVAPSVDPAGSGSGGSARLGAVRLGGRLGRRVASARSTAGSARGSPVAGRLVGATSASAVGGIAGASVGSSASRSVRSSASGSSSSRRRRRGDHGERSGRGPRRRRRRSSRPARSAVPGIIGRLPVVLELERHRPRPARAAGAITLWSSSLLLPETRTASPWICDLTFGNSSRISLRDLLRQLVGQAAPQRDLLADLVAAGRLDLAPVEDLQRQAAPDGLRLDQVLDRAARCSSSVTRVELVLRLRRARRSRP